MSAYNTVNVENVTYIDGVRVDSLSKPELIQRIAAAKQSKASLQSVNDGVASSHIDEQIEKTDEAIALMVSLLDD